MKTSPAPWPYPPLFAHRGGGAAAPENTLAAMKVGRAHGYRAVEFDVKLAADNVALLMHDATLTRTTNGHGNIAETSMAQLETFDAGGWHSAPFRGEPIPRFSAIAAFLREQGMMANVEIKPCPGRDAETGRLVAEAIGAWWVDAPVQPLVSSFSIESLRAARAVNAHLPIGLLVDRLDLTILATLSSLAAVSLHCNHKNLDLASIAHFHEAGYRVLVYTVNHPERASALLASGVDGIFTDNLAAMAARFPGQL